MSLSKKVKSGLLITLILLVVGAVVGYKIMYKPHETTEDMEVTYKGSATDFKTKVAAEPEKWNNAVVVLMGTVTEKDDKGFILNESIYCQVREAATLQSIANEAEIKIKGRFIGYDDLLEEIKLDKCILLND